MKFKVDENLPREVCDLLSRAGHDAASVGEQGLSGADDARIYERCQDEGRAFITLDVDFANVHAYQPRSSAGVVCSRRSRHICGLSPRGTAGCPARLKTLSRISS
jgi:hypothetical protein